MIVRNAHATGEPGVCYIDRVNEDNPIPCLGKIEATNPCGEQPLLPFEACTLGSINVAKFVNTGDSKADLDWSGLAKTVSLAVRFLDDTIDASNYPITDTARLAQANRKIGLGIMGFADAIILLGIRYDSKNAVSFASKLCSFIQKQAHQANQELARERGCFPNWEGSVWDKKHHRPVRNAAVTTIAPTGSISLIAGCNGGIEPIFSIVSKRKTLDDREFVQLSPVVEKLGVEGRWLSDSVRNSLSQGVSLKDIAEMPKGLAEILVTAHETSPEWHVCIQAAFQKHVYNAVSKTVNLPFRATVRVIDRVYRLAFQLGCKGITVYRDGSRNNQVITTGGKIDMSPYRKLTPIPRPYRTQGETFKFRTGCETLFVTVNSDDQGLCEVFANLGKAGGCAAQTEATCRTISISLRSGVDPKELIEQLKNIRCPSTMVRKKTNKDIKRVSCADAIAAAMEEAWGEN